MHRMRLDVLDESNRKRPAPVEPTDGLDQAKRQRLGANVIAPAAPTIPPLPPGPVSWRQLFTLDPNSPTANIDVQMFKDPESLLRVLVPVLQSIDGEKLGFAINVSGLFALSRRCSYPIAYVPQFAPGSTRVFEG